MRLQRYSALIVAVFLVVCSSAYAQQTEDEREKVERVQDILKALGARDGAHIADIGAGNGFYSLRIAKAVGPSGRAYAIDIDQKSLDALREAAAKEAITNVEIVLSEPADPKLPTNTLDAVLIRNAYHEITDHRGVLKGVLGGLKPGGLLIVSESISEKARGLSRDLQVKDHYISADIVEGELREAGFEILGRDDSFTTFRYAVVGGYWLIKARRSAAQ